MDIDRGFDRANSTDKTLIALQGMVIHGRPSGFLRGYFRGITWTVTPGATISYSRLLYTGVSYSGVLYCLRFNAALSRILPLPRHRHPGCVAVTIHADDACTRATNKLTTTAILVL